MQRRPTSPDWLFPQAGHGPRSDRSREAETMAKIYIPATGECEILDDIDFMAEARTVCFSLDGIHYEVDLSAANLQKLLAALQPFINVSHVIRRNDIRQ